VGGKYSSMLASDAVGGYWTEILIASQKTASAMMRVPY